MGVQRVGTPWGHVHGLKIVQRSRNPLSSVWNLLWAFLGCQRPGVACESPGISGTLKVEIADPQGSLLRNLLFRTRLTSIAPIEFHRGVV